MPKKIIPEGLFVADIDLPEPLDQYRKVGRVIKVARDTGLFKQVFLALNSPTEAPTSGDFLVTDAAHRGAKGGLQYLAGAWLPTSAQAEKIEANLGRTMPDAFVDDWTYYPAIISSTDRAQAIIGLLMDTSQAEGSDTPAAMHPSRQEFTVQTGLIMPSIHEVQEAGNELGALFLPYTARNIETTIRKLLPVARIQPDISL